MEQPGQPHVRNFGLSTYIERAPGAWVRVCDMEEFTYLAPHERQYVIARALKHAPECELPPR